MSGTVRVAALCGSLRRESFNAAALRAAIEMTPEGMTITEAPISDLPLYNDDIRQAGYPETVIRFRQALTEADAVLFVTPEYNFRCPAC